MKSLSTEKVRHVLLRAAEGESLPDALASELRDLAVTCGWMRASGVLGDVELRAYDAESGSLGEARRIAGPVHVVSLEGSVGLSAGDVSFGMRAVIARDTDRGLETLAGEIVSARVIALEVLVAAFDEHALPRAFDAAAQVWLLGEPDRTGAPRAATGGDHAGRRGDAPSARPRAEPPAEWGAAIAASAPAPADRPRPAAPSPPGLGAPIPPRPVRPQETEPEGQLPEAGDLVEHFAFGRCDVLKSDGDRLYLKMHKDGRIKEIALEMLKVTLLPDEDGKRVFKLARRL